MHGWVEIAYKTLVNFFQVFTILSCALMPTPFDEKSYDFVCVCMHARACVHARVFAYMGTCILGCAPIQVKFVYELLCKLSNPWSKRSLFHIVFLFELILKIFCYKSAVFSTNLCWHSGVINFVKCFMKITQFSMD